jgi:hypothetical protein
MGRPATLRVDIATNAKTTGIDQTESRLGKFGSRAKSVGKAAALGLAAVGVAAGAAAKVAVDAASRQQQAYGALDSIYGKSAKRVKAWAATAADSVGLARSEYAELSSLVGAQLTNMGLSTDKAAAKSNALIKTGADLAATFGGSVSDAVSAVSSLLKGETDPIERYGVSIKAADVSARLAADGLDGLTGKAAKQAQAQALLSLLTEQTTKSQGAFARESNTLAGQQERLKAKFENVKATIGTALLPMLTRLFSWVNERLLPGATRLGRYLSDRFGPAMARVGEWVSTRLVPALRNLVSWFMDKVYPSIKAAVIPILNGARSAFGSVAAAIERNKGPLMDIVRFLGRVIEVSGPVRHVVGVLLGAAFRGAGKFIGAMVDGIGFLVNGLGTLGSYLDWIIGKLRALASGPTKILSKLGSLFTAEGPHRMTPRLVGWAPGVTSPGASFTTAGLVTGAGIDLAGLGALTPARASYVDARSFPVTVQVDGGALVDPAVVDRIQRSLDQRQRQLGRQPAFGAV